ncbi:hypothetical protein HY229_09270 [Candidatus Acetothermia bacterium]|nr:hypothetical protein [Candidatus Acetothermia bacterium]MBI3644272.1 hypothetical protein [Candidatus Acetothermia bacterium]
MIKEQGKMKQNESARNSFWRLAIMLSLAFTPALPAMAQPASGTGVVDPSDIFEDTLIVGFTTLLVLITPFLFAWAGNPQTWQRRERTVLVLGSATLRDPAYSRLAGIFLLALIFQSFHMAEHVAQIIQKFPLGETEAHGLLGTILDREWVHLAYNGVYFGLLAILLLGYRSVIRGSTRVEASLFMTLLWFVYLFEGYHVAEHGMRVIQHLEWGVEDTPGLMGQFFPAIWVHFIYNLLVYLPMLLTFFGAGVYQALLPSRKRALASRESLSND